MAVDVLTEITIDKPLHEVAEYAANPDHAPEWYVNIKSAERLPPVAEDPVLTVGSKIAFKAQFLGQQLVYSYEIVEYVSNQKLVMRTAEGPFPMETSYTWSAVDSGHTHMTLRNTGQPRGFSKLFAPFMEVMMRKANNKDLKRLKKILENRR